MTSPSTEIQWLLHAQIVQNFHLVWLDESIGQVNDEDYRSSITQLQQAVSTVNTFIDVDACIDFITDINEQVFMIISHQFSQTTVPIIQNIPQISSIYVYRKNSMHQHGEKAKEWIKVVGVYTDIKSICEALKKPVQDCDHNASSITFLKTTDGISNKNLDQLDSSFMYTQILKEILLSIDFEQQHFQEFLSYCREQFSGNASELKNVDKIEREYSDHEPIWWYTYQCFLYSMLNRALRTMEVDLIIKMGFFVRDLHNHIARLHTQQYGTPGHSDSSIVYRGQGLSQTDFDQLKKTQDGLLAFNNFLSSSLERHVALRFARRSITTSDLVGVLFTMTIDPSLSTTPFANIKDFSRYQGEEEILFSMHSIFRIGKVEQIENNDRLWQVELILTSDHDPQLQVLTETMQEEIEGSTGWFRLARLLMKISELDKAEQVFNILLKKTTDEGEKQNIYHYLGWIKRDQGKYTEALSYYEKASEIQQKILPANHPYLATAYNNIGEVYRSMGEYSKSLSHYEKAFEIQQKILPASHSNLAASYNNIGELYRNMGEYSKALPYYERALEISRKILPENHPSLATHYNNIGLVHCSMGDCSKALSYYEKAFEIRQKTLPENHPDLAASYNNIGGLYRSVSEYSKALSYYEKAFKIRQKTLPENHPDLATSYNNIGLVYYSMGECSKALSYYKKALEIRQKTLPENHSDLAASYNNIGEVHRSIGEYSKALSYYEKCLEIFKRTLPENHPDLATYYNNIASVYYSIGEYSKALPYYEKVFEIRQKTLPESHPDLATYYNNIGLVYYSMGEYSRALSYYQQAFEIYKKTFPENHPELATYYNNIGLVYRSMGDYSKTLLYYEKAFEIYKKTLPENHPNLATSYNNIGLVYYSMGKYSKALSYYQHALNILQRSVPSSHPHLRYVKESIEIIKMKL